MSYGEVAPGPGARETILNTGALRVRPLAVRTLTTTAQLASMGGRLRGWSARETTGNTGAVVELYDGSNASGQLLVPVGVTSGQSANAWFGDDGIDVESGVFVNMAFGSADVVIYYQFDTGEY